MLSNRIVQDVIAGRMKQTSSLTGFPKINALHCEYGCHKFKAQVVLLAGLQVPAYSRFAFAAGNTASNECQWNLAKHLLHLSISSTVTLIVRSMKGVWLAHQHLAVTLRCHRREWRSSKTRVHSPNM
jgi:hypothetical protein